MPGGYGGGKGGGGLSSPCKYATRCWTPNPAAPSSSTPTTHQNALTQPRSKLGAPSNPPLCTLLDPHCTSGGAKLSGSAMYPVSSAFCTAWNLNALRSEGSFSDLDRVGPPAFIANDNSTGSASCAGCSSSGLARPTVVCTRETEFSITIRVSIILTLPQLIARRLVPIRDCGRSHTAAPSLQPWCATPLLAHSQSMDPTPPQPPRRLCLRSR